MYNYNATEFVRGCGEICKTLRKGRSEIFDRQGNDIVTDTEDS
jgi:hypothetical protein